MVTDPIMFKRIYFSALFAVSFSCVSAALPQPHIDVLVQEVTTEAVGETLSVRVIRLNSESRLLSKKNPKPPLLVLELFYKGELVDQTKLQGTLKLVNGERLSLEKVSAVFINSVNFKDSEIVVEIDYIPLTENSRMLECKFRIQNQKIHKPKCAAVS